MQNRFRPLNRELRRSRNDLILGLRSSRGVRSAWFFALLPNLMTISAVDEVSRGFRGGTPLKLDNDPRSPCEYLPDEGSCAIPHG
eukprot:6698574-Alexandrium_andersonii.AAC.1